VCAQHDQVGVFAVFDELFDAILRRREPEAATGLFADDADVVMWGSEASEPSGS
jgi:hypothetical protein